MNKAQFIDRCLDFALQMNLSPSDFYVNAGGTLLLYGLREQTEDIDITIPANIYDNLKIGKYEKFAYPKTGDLPAVYGFKFSQYIDAHRENYEWETTMVSGIQVQTLDEVLVMKRKMNRPKDQEDIKKIVKYLANNKGH